MPRLSAQQLHARERILRLATQTLPPNVLGEALMEAVRGAISCDVYSLYAVDPASLLFTRVLAASDRPDAAGRLHWLRYTYLVRQPGRCNPPGLMRMGLTTVALHEDLRRCAGVMPALLGTDSPQAWWHRFHEIEAAPFRNVLAGSCAVDGRWVAGLTLVRADPDTAWFRETDLTFLRVVAPVVGQAIRAALTREQAALPMGGVPDGMVGVIALERGCSRAFFSRCISLR
jgi:hypothetical protein